MSLKFFSTPLKEEQEIRERARLFVNERIRPTALDDDRENRFRRENFDSLARGGLASIITDKKFGGMGLAYRCYIACIEELARGTLSIAVTAGVNNLPQGALTIFGNDSQKEKFLKPLGQGQWLGAFSLSEPNSGSDAASLRLSAKKSGDGYVLNGTKCWCSSVGEADIYLVMGRTAEHRTKGISAFLVTSEMEGFRPGKLEKKLGLRASPLGELVFENCFVPQSHLLGQEGQGLEVALSQLDTGRIVIGAASVGLATEALDRACQFRFAKQKKDPSYDDGMSNRLAEHYASLQAARSLLDQTAQLREQGKPITVAASQVKLFASDLAMQITTDVLQCFGANAMNEEYEVERMFRDAKSLQIVEGTNQIQRLVLAREMERMYS